MTEIPKTGDDSILPFQLDALDVRGRVARLDETIDTILTRHAYPPPVSGLVAEAALLTALIGQTIKLRDRFSIQVRGDGPVRLIATDYFAPKVDGAPAQLRAYASFEADDLDAETRGIALLGKGLMGVTLFQGIGQPYQGVTPLAGDSLADCAEIYFAQSEQIATRFVLSSAQASEPGQPPKWRAGGVVIQHLPDASPLMQKDAPDGSTDGLMTADAVASMSDAEEDWRTAAIKLATTEEHELIGPHIPPEKLLLRLFHEDAPRVYAPQTVAFGCTCSSKKLFDVLKGYSDATLDEIAEDRTITADCQFCGMKYAYDVSTLIAARDAPVGETPQ